MRSVFSKRVSLRCSVCGKPDGQVVRLIAGPKVFICHVCVGVCNKILDAIPTARDGWGAMTNERLFESLKVATVEAVRAILQTPVEACVRGRSVGAIGDAVGISRQVAWEPFLKSGNA